MKKEEQRLHKEIKQDHQKVTKLEHSVRVLTQALKAGKNQGHRGQEKGNESRRSRRFHANAANLEQKVRRPVVTKGILHQPKDTKEVLTAWDEQLVAKQHPGQFNTAYVAGMNVTNLPTSTFSVSNSFAKANVFTTTNSAPLGTSEYTLMMWCNSATAFSGDGAPDNIPASDRLGGFVLKQINAADISTPFICRDLFQESLSAFTMLEAYGSDMTGFSAGGYVWASEATFNVLTPAANLIGSYFRGTLQWGQMAKATAQGLSLQQLIEISGDVEVMKPQFHLRTGVVNHGIVYDSQQIKGEFVHDAQFVGELVNYVILQKVAASITTGENAEFELQCNIKGNTVFWGKPKDSIANNLFKDNSNAKSPLPGVLAGVNQNPDAPPAKQTSFWSGAKRMLSKVWDSGIIGNIATHVLPMLLAEAPPKEDVEPVAVKVNYLKSLENVLIGLQQMQLQNQFFDIADIQQAITLEYERVRIYPDRLIPIEPQTPQNESIQSTSRAILSQKTKLQK